MAGMGTPPRCAACSPNLNYETLHPAPAAHSHPTCQAIRSRGPGLFGDQISRTAPKNIQPGPVVPLLKDPVLAGGVGLWAAGAE